MFSLLMFRIHICAVSNLLHGGISTVHNTTDTNKLDKMGESTVSDEKPKRGSVTPSGSDPQTG